MRPDTEAFKRTADKFYKNLTSNPNVATSVSSLETTSLPLKTFRRGFGAHEKHGAGLVKRQGQHDFIERSLQPQCSDGALDIPFLTSIQKRL